MSALLNCISKVCGLAPSSHNQLCVCVRNEAPDEAQNEAENKAENKAPDEAQNEAQNEADNKTPDKLQKTPPTNSGTKFPHTRRPVAIRSADSLKAETKWSQRRVGPDVRPHQHLRAERCAQGCNG